MARIYENAASVMVYLGRSTERTEEAMRVLRWFMDPEADAVEAPWSYSAMVEVEQSLEDILYRPWFDRIWTVQEVTLARHTTMICGQHRVSWQVDLQTVRSILFRIKATAISPESEGDAGYASSLAWSRLLDILETQLRQAARRENVVIRRNHLDLMYDFRNRQCHDRRDKYFAILNIIENDAGGRMTLAPDYRCTLQEVHQQYMASIQKILETDQSMQSYCSQG